MAAQGNDYEKWSDRELRRAESVAGHFLRDNVDTIGGTLRAKVDLLDGLVEKLRNRQLTLDERLHIFARIEETAQSLQEDAQGLFHMASEPMVARILAQVAAKPR